MTGIVSRIQRFSVGDGPGIRSTVFLKGCPLHCRWCHNPETMSIKPLLMYHNSLCVKCGKCIDACGKNVHKLEDGKHMVDYEKCTACGDCVAKCPNGAVETDGAVMNSDEVVSKVAEDFDFYRESGGGVTLSGGEPMLQRKFTEEIAEKLFKRGIDVLLDTSAAYGFGSYKDILPYVSTFFVDLKAASEYDYKYYTGGSLEPVLEAIKGLCEAGKSVTVRIPIIPKLSEDCSYAERMADLLRDMGVRNVDMLPFHNLCRDKYASLGKKYEYAEFESLKKENLKPLMKAFEGYNIRITN